MSKTQVRVNGVIYAGQNPEHGITVAVDPAVQVGDVVTLDATGTAVRSAAGAEPVGVMVVVEKDGRGTLENFENLKVVPYTGNPVLGLAGIQTNGTGGVQFVAAGTAASLKVLCFGADATALTAAVARQ